MENESLFKPLQIGAIEAQNRIILAPLTRCRAVDNHVANDLMAEYYSQRASGGLLIAEATMVMEGNSSFITEPGIYSADHAEGWKKVTEAVHEKGGKIVLQLWHGGRACHPLLNDGRQPVAPSAIPITGDEIHTPEGKKPYVTPRALTDEEIPEIVAGFKKAAQHAKDAGFDGIEIHGANGYLIDEFLRDSANRRENSKYGGSFENRARLLFEILDAVTEAWPTNRVGLRISPLNSYNSMKDSAPEALYSWLAGELNQYKLAFLHVMRADLLQQQEGDVLTPIREAWDGVLISNMGYTPEEAASAVASGSVDAIAFGTSFLANPDLPERIAAGADLNDPDPATFYSTGPEGYIDYPTMS
ncbi:UNVERIFIED_CONTAM: hypothetical protein GTU68_059563 [Idotea baltica]|nr:hypothetical protein [Idotea baltica]